MLIDTAPRLRVVSCGQALSPLLSAAHPVLYLKGLLLAFSFDGQADVWNELASLGPLKETLQVADRLFDPPASLPPAHCALKLVEDWLREVAAEIAAAHGLLHFCDYYLSFARWQRIWGNEPG
ncbi:hypothetical protein ACFWZ3_08695 [Frateuria sp. GZRR35]